MNLEIWSDDPIVPVAQKVSSSTGSTGAIVLRIGTTLIKLQLTKDSTDSSRKRPELEEPANKSNDLSRRFPFPEDR
jgi:hypothetical protein